MDFQGFPVEGISVGEDIYSRSVVPILSFSPFLQTSAEQGSCNAPRQRAFRFSVYFSSVGRLQHSTSFGEDEADPGVRKQRVRFPPVGLVNAESLSTQVFWKMPTSFCKQ